MLAQNFQSATDLGITEEQKDALVKTLVLMETGKLVHVSEEEFSQWQLFEEEPQFSGLFNMGQWGANDTPYLLSTGQCGTIACIGGTAELIANKPIFRHCGDLLHSLFYPEEHSDWDSITVEQAARVLRHFLTTGEVRWSIIG